MTAKIAHDITQYDSSQKQVKCSLLQDLVINSLTTPADRQARSALFDKLQRICSRAYSENVAEWLDAMLSVYLQSPEGQETVRGLTPAQLSACSKSGRQPVTL